MEALLRIPPSVLKMHNKKEDAWTAINGKVYNITPYLPYHPGGEKELMRVAGRDGTKLFCEIHIDSVLTGPLIDMISTDPCVGECRLYARCMSRRTCRLGIIRIIELYFRIYVHTHRLTARL